MNIPEIRMHIGYWCMLPSRQVIRWLFLCLVVLWDIIFRVSCTEAMGTWLSICINITNVLSIFMVPKFQATPAQNSELF
jgi:hypothetical protein